jgi:hypothetical protein
MYQYIIRYHYSVHLKDRSDQFLPYSDAGSYMAHALWLLGKVRHSRGYETARTSMSNSWPEVDEVAATYERFVQGDRVAQSDFIAMVLDPLVNYLRAWREGSDEHMRISAAEDAILSLIRNPALYDKAKGTLIYFLCMAAKADLLNALESERRYHRGRENNESVELQADSRNPSTDEAADDLPSFDDPALASEIACFTQIERQVFELMRQGERRTSAFAALLDIGHLPTEEQASVVYRMKEKILMRLKRAGRKA